MRGLSSEFSRPLSWSQVRKSGPGAPRAKLLISLVVALEDDLLLVPAEAGEPISNGGDHVVEAADVGVNIERRRLGHRHFFHGYRGSGS